MMLPSLFQHWVQLLYEVLELPLQLPLVLELLLRDAGLVLHQSLMTELSELLEAHTQSLMMVALLRERGVCQERVRNGKWSLQHIKQVSNNNNSCSRNTHQQQWMARLMHTWLTLVATPPCNCIWRNLTSTGRVLRACCKLLILSCMRAMENWTGSRISSSEAITLTLVLT